MQSKPMSRPSTQVGTNRNYTNTKKEEHTSTDRRHVNIVDLSPGGERYSEIFPVHRLGVFLGSKFRMPVFLGGLQKKNEYFWIGNFCGYFWGVQ